MLACFVCPQARVSIQAPIQAFQLALSLGLPGKVCRACYAGRSPAACLANLHVQQVVLGFCVPIAIVYCVELRFRATFLSKSAKKCP